VHASIELLLVEQLSWLMHLQSKSGPVAASLKISASASF